MPSSSQSQISLQGAFGSNSSSTAVYSPYTLTIIFRSFCGILKQPSSRGLDNCHETPNVWTPTFVTPYYGHPSHLKSKPSVLPCDLSLTYLLIFSKGLNYVLSEIFRNGTVASTYYEFRNVNQDAIQLTALHKLLTVLLETNPFRKHFPKKTYKTKQNKKKKRKKEKNLSTYSSGPWNQ